MIAEQKGLSNIQKELLKIYANDIPEEELFEIKMLLSKYFADKATFELDRFIRENKLSQDDILKWSEEHHRSEGRN